MNILVTGGTGHLGRPIVHRLRQEGHHVRVLARRRGDDEAVEWIRADLGKGEGVAEGVAGVDVVVHAATNSPAAQRGSFRPGDMVRSPTDVDVDGTRALLDAAADSGVRHFVHVSIVGLRQMSRLPYAKVKIAAEDLVRESAVPWSIVPGASFYWLLDRLLASMTRRRLVLLPAGVSAEPVDSDEFAEYVVEAVRVGPQGERPDFVGPETLSMGELAEQYVAARALRRRIWELPAPSSVKKALGTHSAPDVRRGSITWAEWLRRQGAASDPPSSGA